MEPVTPKSLGLCGRSPSGKNPEELSFHRDRNGTRGNASLHTDRRLEAAHPEYLQAAVPPAPGVAQAEKALQPKETFAGMLSGQAGTMEF